MSLSTDIPWFVKAEMAELVPGDKILYKDDEDHMVFGRVIKSINNEKPTEKISNRCEVLAHTEKGVLVRTRSGEQEFFERNYLVLTATVGRLQQFKRVGFYDLSVGDTLMVGLEMDATKNIVAKTAKITKIEEEIEPAKKGKFMEIGTYLKKTIIAGIYSQPQQYLLKDTKIT